MKFKKLLSTFLVVLILLSFNVCYSAETSSEEIQQIIQSNKPQVFADSAILLDVDYNKILYEKNSQNLMYPASTTKLLTAILVVEHCSDLSQNVNISYYAVNSVPDTYSMANIQPGEQISIKDLLNALLIESANEAAYALAEYVSNEGNNYLTDESQTTRLLFESSIASFSTLMNEKAKQLGCNNTNFVNPNGIHNENHYSTAYDLMLIGKYAYSNSIIRSICQKTQFSLPNTNVYNGEIRTFKTTNSLLRIEKSGFYAYANGLKTGYTDPAQSCIIASANKGDRNLIAVILHSPESEDENASRESDCKRLFEYGFNVFTNSVLIKQGSIVKQIRIENGTESTAVLNLISDSELKTLMINQAPIDITPEIEITKGQAPISQGEVVGSVTYNINGEMLKANLIAEHSVIREDFTYIIIILVCIFLIFIICLVLLIIYKLKHNKDEHKHESKNDKKSKK